MKAVYLLYWISVPICFLGGLLCGTAESAPLTNVIGLLLLSIFIVLSFYASHSPQHERARREHRGQYNSPDAVLGAGIFMAIIFAIMTVLNLVGRLH
jgi:uncharacterized membrane protein YfcA